MVEADGRDSGWPGSRFLINVNLVFVSTIAAYGLGFLAVVLVARELGTQGRGVTALYQAAIGLGFAVLSLGLATALVYFVGRRETTPQKALEAGATVTLLATAVTAIGVGGAALLFADRLQEEQVPFWMALVALPAAVQFRLLEGVLRAQGRFGAMNLLEVSLPLAVFVSLAGIEVVADLTIELAIYGWSLAFVPPVLLGYVLAGTNAWPRRLASVPELLPTVRFGVQAQSGNLIQLLNYRLDSYLVLLFVNTGGVGLYAIGVSLSEGLWFIANSVGVVLLTNLTSGSDEYAQRVTPLVCRNTLAISALAALGAAAVSPLIIPVIFGEAFEGAVQPFLWLLPGTVALAGGKILSAYVFSRGRPMINAWISLATLVVAIGGDFALIPAFGVSGAAAASSLAYGVSLTLTALAYRHLSGSSIRKALIPQPGDIGIWRQSLAGMAHRVPGASQLLARTVDSEANDF